MEKYETKWEVEREGIKVVRIFEELEGGFFSKVRGFWRAMKQLQLKVEEYGAEVIHAHDLETLETAVNAAKKNDAKVIFDSHEDWPMMEIVQNWFIGKYY